MLRVSLIQTHTLPPWYLSTCSLSFVLLHLGDYKNSQ